MKYKAILAVFLVFVLFFLLLRIDLVKDSSRPDFFFGVDAVSDNVEEIKRLVDKVKSYTNFFVIGSTGITENETKLNQVCHYIYESGLYFTFYAHPTDKLNQTRWIEEARQRWGNRFLGLYAFDEAGGHQVDHTGFMLVPEADNYTDAADKFVGRLGELLNYYRDYSAGADKFPLITSDYALYWFDYEAGYDVVLCEFGWNHSRLLSVALNRGAAKMQHKDWGVIITWTYWAPPYIESADELYYDMVLAYLSGAKYLVIFNRPMSPEDGISEYGILTEEHLGAMKRFWSYIHTNPQTDGVFTPTCNQVAYVLPKDYGWGFRGYEDEVWGLWLDELSTKIGIKLNYLLHTHHLSLDIVYDEPKYCDNMRLYSKLVFWNGTTKTNDNQS